MRAVATHIRTSERYDLDFLANFPEERKKKVMWKLDIRLVPMLGFLYLIAFLDRANIGENAQTRQH